MWNTICKRKKKKDELWVKVPMTCNSSEEKSNLILALIDLLERNIKIYPHE